MGKKHIMQLPTNVPRLKKGAGLFGGKVYDEVGKDLGKYPMTEDFQNKRREELKDMPVRSIKPKDNFSGRVYGVRKHDFLKDTSEYRKKATYPWNKEFWDLLRLGKPKQKDYINLPAKPKKKIAI
tara:strand:+ start:827 stop:1201 length:375 start_codon:yes stop_codon:yes gene_type:complete